MAKIDTHGLTIKGLRKASGETSDYGAYSAMYSEIFYDRATGEVWTVLQCNLGQNSWTEYHGPDVIKVGNTQHHMTMQALADAICVAVNEKARGF